jgi:hypothetical protein
MTDHPHSGGRYYDQGRTEDGIAMDLLREGVPKDDIVLGFQPPELRPYTEFAAA